MALAAEENQIVSDRSGPGLPNSASLIARSLAALVLMTLAGNCFLKYLWWTAKYSALAGIPKVAAQWQAAGTRATFYGWSLLLLETASAFVLFTAIGFRAIASPKLRITFRFVSSLVITAVGTGLLALVLSWIKQAVP